MKTKILSIVAVMILAVSMVFAAPIATANKVTDKEKLFKKELSYLIVKQDYQNLTIDKSFEIDNVTFEGNHPVYSTIDKNNEDFVNENKYVTSAVYNGDEIANIFYQLEDGKFKNVEVVLDDARENNDVIINAAKKQMSSIEDKNQISFYMPNDKTTIAFTDDTYKMFVVEDEYARYDNYLVEEKDGTKTIDRAEFFQLHKDNKIKNNNLNFVENTVTLQVILILLFAILAILSFLSYILINKDKINNETAKDKKVVEKKATTKRATTTKKAATTAKKTTTKKTK